MTPATPILRFAPSPNGRLHLGHAYSALINAELAARMGGRFLLRIEDIDITRCTPAFTQDCMDDLAWLGIAWEEPVRIQSQHWDDYAAALDRLEAQGLLYPCFCTRSEVASASAALDPDGAPLYPGTCKHMPAHEIAARMASGAPYCRRIDMEKAMNIAPVPLDYTRFTPHTGESDVVHAQPRRWGDAILARKDIPASYHIAVVTDDAIQGVTHIVRGRDLEAATCLHRLLQALLDLPVPAYYHHPLITNPAGDKLSKSKGHESLSDLRSKGASPSGIRRLCAQGAATE